MSFSGIVSISSFNLLFLTQVLTALTTTAKYTQLIIDKGKNLSLSCDVHGSIMWFKENGENNSFVQIGRVLLLTNVSEVDAGIYICLFPELKNRVYSVTKRSDLKNTDIFQEHLKANLTVRTPPGPVTKLEFKASTILGYLIWRFDKTKSGGYPIRSFTAEYRNISGSSNKSYDWSRLDPINISPNVRQMEVYHLLPNTTYEFRMWANNILGAGAIVATNVTTLPETKEEDLIRLIKADIDSFDPRIWIIAVSIVLGTLAILATGLCLVLTRECQQATSIVDEDEDGWDSIELVPNIILNPGFCENDDRETPFTRTIIFGEDDESDGYESEEESISFKRKVSIFFTGHTIKRI